MVGTTRPETLPGDVAVAVHPTDSRYTVVLSAPCVLAFHPRALSSLPFRVAAPPLCSLFLFLNFPHLSSPVALTQLPSLPDVTLQLKGWQTVARGPDLLFLCEPPSFPVYRLQLHRVLSNSAMAVERSCRD